MGIPVVHHFGERRNPAQVGSKADAGFRRNDEDVIGNVRPRARRLTRPLFDDEDDSENNLNFSRLYLAACKQ